MLSFRLKDSQSHTLSLRLDFNFVKQNFSNFITKYFFGRILIQGKKALNIVQIINYDLKDIIQ